MSIDESNHERFERLLQAHRGIPIKVAATYCWRPDDRADLVQEIVTQVWRAFPRYDSDRPFSTWMYRIALNVAISHVRSAQRHLGRTVPLDDSHLEVPSAAAGPLAAGRFEDDERLCALRQLIDELPPLERAVLLLYLEDKPHREIAEILGMTDTNVATKISRLKQRIRRDLASAGGR